MTMDWIWVFLTQTPRMDSGTRTRQIKTWLHYRESIDLEEELAQDKWCDRFKKVFNIDPWLYDYDWRWWSLGFPLCKRNMRRRAHKAWRDFVRLSGWNRKEPSRHTCVLAQTHTNACTHTFHWFQLYGVIPKISFILHNLHILYESIAMLCLHLLLNPWHDLLQFMSNTTINKGVCIIFERKSIHALPPSPSLSVSRLP